MPLSASLLTVEMTFECPHCGHALVKRGSWFQVATRFKCKGCEGEIRLNYPDRLKIFARHAHLA
jgi:transposase-like protein